MQTYSYILERLCALALITSIGNYYTQIFEMFKDSSTTFKKKLVHDIGTKTQISKELNNLCLATSKCNYLHDCINGMINHIQKLKNSLKMITTIEYIESSKKITIELDSFIKYLNDINKTTNKKMVHCWSLHKDKNLMWQYNNNTANSFKNKQDKSFSLRLFNKWDVTHNLTSGSNDMDSDTSGNQLLFYHNHKKNPHVTIHLNEWGTIAKNPELGEEKYIVHITIQHRGGTTIHNYYAYHENGSGGGDLKYIISNATHYHNGVKYKEWMKKPKHSNFDDHSIKKEFIKLIRNVNLLNCK